MKSKIILLLLFLASFAYEVSAFTIIIRGGGGAKRYKVVEMTREKLKCTGQGSLYCPLLSFLVNSNASARWYDLGEVVNYVDKQVSTGIKSGDENYNNDLPIRWDMQDEENIEITIEESGVRELENTEE